MEIPLDQVSGSWSLFIRDVGVWKRLHEYHQLQRQLKDELSILTCFRRASAYYTREVDLFPPDVNRNGSFPRLQGSCLVNVEAEKELLCRDLRKCLVESQCILKTPRLLRVSSQANSRLVRGHSSDRGCFDFVRIIPGGEQRVPGDHIISGSIHESKAKFWLWSLSTSLAHGYVASQLATCFDVCDTALAIGNSDGTVKIWNLSVYDTGWKPLHDAANLAATITITNRSTRGLSINSFLSLKSTTAVAKVSVDCFEGAIRLAKSSIRGDVFVHNTAKGQVMLSLSPERIHTSSLSTSTLVDPQVSKLMLFRNKIVVGTSAGLIRVFDLRSGKLSHRLAGHPDAVSHTDTNGGVLWSGGRDGSVRWWGGKSPKILSKSNLCQGAVSVMEMNDTMVVAGFQDQGMQAWDLRTQAPFAVFSNGMHGGVKALQFDNTKLITVSNNGMAAMWNWRSRVPSFWFPELCDGDSYVSAHYDSESLILGTEQGSAYAYSLRETKG